MWASMGNTQLSEISYMLTALTALQARGRPINTWEFKSVHRWWEHHSEWVLSTAESIRAYCVLTSTADGPCSKQQSKQKFTNDHLRQSPMKSIDNYIEQVHNLTSIINEQNLVGGDVNMLYNEWKIYQDLFVAYKEHNEALGVKNRRAFFGPPTEGAKKDTKRMYRVSPGLVTATIHYVGKDHFRCKIMPREQLSDTTWDFFLEDWYRHYTREVVVHLDALVAGKAPSYCSFHENDFCKHPKSKFCPTTYYNPNPTDLKYQQDKHYPPFQLELWGDENLSIYMSTVPRTLLKRALVAGVVAMREALICVQSRGPISEWELVSIQTWFSDHCQFAHSVNHLNRQHHIPYIQQRIRIPDFLLEVNEEIFSNLQMVTNGIDSLQVGDKIDNILDLLTAYEEILIFSREVTDPMMTLLYHAYFSKEEHNNRHYRRISAKLFETQVGPLVYLVGKDMFRNVLMRKQKLPDVDWHLKYGSKYIDYVENVVIHVEALQNGVAPELNKRRNSKLLSRIDTITEEEMESITSKFDITFAISAALKKTSLSEDSIPQKRYIDG
eukprot:CAMPEP_0195304294 /NCGR_PEP_ID=MMETSP0707-20130614/34186_1 /TAXON_ID=33640 /ORGANISM="Asterionellopsis glacialis, Strain CCMP134" /LENGTH=552 /DNA_ID=CAMNT_0040368059 /DNA_START=207 /DNA_END=1865 /DNA_ORIENTATION=-